MRPARLHHASTGGIDHTQEEGLRINQFAPTSGPGREGCDQPAEIVQLFVHGRRELQTVGRLGIGVVGDDRLELGKQAPTAWDGKYHAVQFPNQLLPFAAGCAALVAPDRGEEEKLEAIESVGRKLDGAIHCVKMPSQNRFGCSPGSISLGQLFGGVGLLSLGVVARGKGPQH
jgi:hypothetical protein